jgi:hypothetical protein
MISVTYNPAQLQAFKNAIMTLTVNAIVRLPTAVMELMDKTKATVIKNTHYISHRLQGGWVVERQGNSIKLMNTIWYASDEFRRPGTNPRFGTAHNPLPSAIDLFSSNIESTVTKAMLTGISR